MRGSIRLLSILAVAALVLTPKAASADTWLTPYIGTSFNTDFGGYDPGKALFYGGSLTWLADSGLGFEIDLGYSPNFFEPGNEDFFDFNGDGNQTTLMANLLFGWPLGPVQPYVTGGAGLMRSALNSPGDLFDYSDNAFGFNAGAGVRIGTGPVGLRADARYFRQIDDISPINDINLGNFSYWRGTLGVSFGF
ncbi:MAG: outer membrane beta-barrel protein [Vicinamibacterales bacterium]